MSFKFRPAERTAAKPLICFYGQSGGGKTLSALLLARGFVGENGKIAMLDTESGRGEIYSDVVPGGYSVAEIIAPFTPQNYVGALKAAEKEGDVVIIDSVSHEWEGTGGVLDMAGAEAAKRGGGLHNWIEPKKAHQQFVLALLQSPATVIICCRAKHKTKQTKSKSGKTEVIKDDFTSPIQADEFIFEMTVHAEVLQDHTLRVTKCSHPDLQKIFKTGIIIDVKTGEQLADWAAGAGKLKVDKPIVEDKEWMVTDEASTIGDVLDEIDSKDYGAIATEALMQTARKKASQGKEAMRSYWRNATKRDQELLEPILPELQNLAKAAGERDKQNG